MAKIKLNNNEYSIPDSTLATAKNKLVSHFGTVAGSGIKVIVGGVEYSVDANKVAGAIATLSGLLNSLSSGGETLNITDENATLVSEVNEAGGQTAIIN